MRPRLLDLFCGAGGCSVGYHRAGFDVVGVDHQPMPRYPFEFIKSDALEYLAGHGKEFDAIHASPPCQAFSVATAVHGHAVRAKHPDLIAPCRDLLQETGYPWVIENVPGAPLRPHCIMLCGMMFGLRVLRHRWFESNILLLSPPHPRHPVGMLTNSKRAFDRGESRFVCVAGHNFSRSAGESAMRIDWMGSRRELSQAIPPAYTEFIGQQLIRALDFSISDSDR